MEGKGTVKISTLVLPLKVDFFDIWKKAKTYFSRCSITSKYVIVIYRIVS